MLQEAGEKVGPWEAVIVKEDEVAAAMEEGQVVPLVGQRCYVTYPRPSAKP